MNRVVKFFHQLFRPHCDKCVDEPPCQNCEELKSLLTTEKHEKKQLLDVILRYHSPVPSPVVEQTERPEPIRTSPIPWRVRQQMLEQESARKKQILEDKQKEDKKESVEELERDLGVTGTDDA